MSDDYLLRRPAGREKSPPATRLRSIAKISITLVTMVLLTGMGGEAMVASPVLLPALWWAEGNARTRFGRAGLAFLAGLVVAEVAWLGVYESIGEREPFIWLGPLLAFAATVTLYVRHGAHSARRTVPTGGRRRLVGGS